MVKKNLFIIIVLSILFYFPNVFSQEKRDNLWWLRTPKNIKYEENYKYALSKIECGVLKQQIKKFIKSYISQTDRKKEEIAIEISSIFSKNNNEKKYNITYISDYYNYIAYDLNINQIAEIDGRIVFIRCNRLKGVIIKKEIIFGLLRDRFKALTQKNNISYAKDSIYSINAGLEHQIPNWILTIQDDKLIDKKIILE